MVVVGSDVASVVTRGVGVTDGFTSTVLVVTTLGPTPIVLEGIGTTVVIGGAAVGVTDTGAGVV